MSKTPDERAQARSRARASLQTISAKEDAAVRAGASSDPNNPKWAARDFRRSRWLADVKPAFAEAAKRRKGVS